MNISTKAILIGIAATMSSSGAFSQNKSQFRILSTYKIASTGGWDYILADPGSRNLYVSHGTQVNILDKNTGDSLGYVPNTTGVHGIALVPALGKGYTSNGRLNNVTVFELSGFKILGQIAAGENPDAIFYEEYSKKIITCNGRSQDITIIDPDSGKAVATTFLGGKPETAVSDGAGKIYINLEDKNEIAVVNAKTYAVENKWPLGPGKSPTGLAIDRATHRLFAGCEKILVILNTENGSIVTTIPIGDGCDGVGFDKSLKTIFTSNGEGTLSIIREESGDKFSFVENLPTKRSARTLSVDESNHRVYLPAAEFERPPPATKENPRSRGKMIPGSFQVLVIGRS